MPALYPRHVLTACLVSSTCTDRFVLENKFSITPARIRVSSSVGKLSVVGGKQEHHRDNLVWCLM